MVRRNEPLLPEQMIEDARKFSQCAYNGITTVSASDGSQKEIAETNVINGTACSHIHSNGICDLSLDEGEQKPDKFAGKDESSTIAENSTGPGSSEIAGTTDKTPHPRTTMVRRNEPLLPEQMIEDSRKFSQCARNGITTMSTSDGSQRETPETNVTNGTACSHIYSNGICDLSLDEGEQKPDMFAGNDHSSTIVENNTRPGSLEVAGTTDKTPHPKAAMVRRNEPLLPEQMIEDSRKFSQCAHNGITTMSTSDGSQKETPETNVTNGRACLHIHSNGICDLSLDEGEQKPEMFAGNRQASTIVVKNTGLGSSEIAGATDKMPDVEDAPSVSTNQSSLSLPNGTTTVSTRDGSPEETTETNGTNGTACHLTNSDSDSGCEEGNDQSSLAENSADGTGLTFSADATTADEISGANFSSPLKISTKAQYLADNITNGPTKQINDTANGCHVIGTETDILIPERCITMSKKFKWVKLIDGNDLMKRPEDHRKSAQELTKSPRSGLGTSSAEYPWPVTTVRVIIRDNAECEMSNGQHCEKPTQNDRRPITECTRYIACPSPEVITKRQTGPEEIKCSINKSLEKITVSSERLKNYVDSTRKNKTIGTEDTTAAEEALEDYLGESSEVGTNNATRVKKVRTNKQRTQRAMTLFRPPVYSSRTKAPKARRRLDVSDENMKMIGKTERRRTEQTKASPPRFGHTDKSRVSTPVGSINKSRVSTPVGSINKLCLSTPVGSINKPRVNTSDEGGCIKDVPQSADFKETAVMRNESKTRTLTVSAMLNSDDMPKQACGSDRTFGSISLESCVEREVMNDTSETSNCQITARGLETNLISPHQRKETSTTVFTFVVENQQDSAVNDPAFWETLHLDDVRLMSVLRHVPTIKLLEKTGPRIKNLTIRSLLEKTDSKVQELVELVPVFCSKIKELTVDFPDMQERALRQIVLKNKLQNLTVLRMFAKSFKSLMKCLKPLTVLQELEIHLGDEIEVDLQKKNIANLISDLGAFLRNNRSLKIVKFFFTINTVMVRSILENCPNLRHLELHVQQPTKHLQPSAFDVPHRKLNTLILHSKERFMTDTWLKTFQSSFPCLRKLYLTGLCMGINPRFALLNASPCHMYVA